MDSPFGVQAHSGTYDGDVFSGPNNSSTEHSNTAAKARAVATDGERRSPSMALTAAREIPTRVAKSACDHLRANRRASTGFDDMFLSYMDIIVSLWGIPSK
jgi:hypothetical protein